MKYPTDPIKAILQGKGLPPTTKTPTQDEQAVLDAAKAKGTAITGGGSVAATSTPGVSSPGALSSTAQANINTGKLLASAYGWGPQTSDWAYLQSGWQEESGWNQHAAYDHADPYNHAYGIPQANPGTKMASRRGRTGKTTRRRRSAGGWPTSRRPTAVRPGCRGGRRTAPRPGTWATRDAVQRP